MKKMTQKQVNEVKALEECADSLMNKRAFDSCMDAIDKYIEAQDLLVKYASDKNALSAYGELKTECLDYKVWHSSLVKKMNDAQAMMAKPDVLRR